MAGAAEVCEGEGWACCRDQAAMDGLLWIGRGRLASLSEGEFGNNNINIAGPPVPAI